MYVYVEHFWIDLMILGECLWSLVCCAVSLSFHSCVCRSQGPVDIEHFRSLMVENCCEKAEEKLMSSWFNQVMALFSGENSLIADIKMLPNQTNRFYQCTSTLIANQV